MKEAFHKFYQKTWQERLETLKEVTDLSADQVTLLAKEGRHQEIFDAMVENYLTDYSLPQGLATNLLLDGKDYVVPMVTEEPSVVAAASNGAGIIKKAGGFTSHSEERLMVGQVILQEVSQPQVIKAQIEAQATDFLACANQAHPSIVRRGGGARFIEVRILSEVDGLVSVDLGVDVKEAMGANMLNTMLEAVAQKIRTELNQDVLMAILSNYALHSLVTVTCEIDENLLAKNDLSGQQVAQKIALASKVAQLDPYRATTHNKGIMNGVDAVVLASGNDWRAIEAGAHAYASRDGQYRGLASWKYQDHKLYGSLTLPMPVGSVGGSIGIIPLVKVNHQLLKIDSAQELAKVIVAIGLGQNLAALKALVTEGIQKGHMHLQLKTLALKVGATSKEVGPLVAQMEARKKRDEASAREILSEIREK